MQDPDFTLEQIWVTSSKTIPYKAPKSRQETCGTIIISTGSFVNHSDATQ